MGDGMVKNFGPAACFADCGAYRKESHFLRSYRRENHRHIGNERDIESINLSRICMQKSQKTAKGQTSPLVFHAFLLFSSLTDLGKPLFQRKNGCHWLSFLSCCRNTETIALPMRPSYCHIEKIVICHSETEIILIIPKRRSSFGGPKPPWRVST